mmetsp:Transcript_14386/g.33238  ORF Transcript_14386/g.33238 Transcript_14386/m.33238 type:complete len:232 (-) Transcript_14386:1226-1921(-)
MQSYDRLGQPALDHSKDKFLVQSCAVSMDFAKKYAEEKSKAASQTGDTASQTAKDLAEALTTMWNAVTAGTPVFNKKLQVRHTVVERSPSSTAPAPNAAPTRSLETNLAAMEHMSPEQMFAEVSSLRRKYDELVSFSVNLTAERDILNNTLEQTKRDLNRETAKRAALENKGGALTGGGVVAEGQAAPLATVVVQLSVVGVACFMAGVKMAQSGQVGFLTSIPVIGRIFSA